MSAANTLAYFVEQQRQGNNAVKLVNYQLLILSWWVRIHSLLSPTEKKHGHKASSRVAQLVEQLTIVKRVSWFKSSLLLRIQNKHTYKYYFLIKTILIGKYIQHKIGKLPSMAWLLKIETDSILIKEKRKQLSKTLDRVSKCCSASAQVCVSKKVVIEVYIDI